MVISDAASVATLEHLLPQPTHFRAQFETGIVDEFVGYINKFKGADIFIDHDKLEADAIFDMGDPVDPEWGHHRAIIKLSKTSDYIALVRGDKARLSQQDMIDFIEDWAENFQFYKADKTKISTANAIALFRKVTIKVNAESTTSQGDFSGIVSAMEGIEINSDGDTLPAFFDFNFVTIVGFDERLVRCGIRAHADTKPTLSYRAIGLDKLTQDIAKEFSDRIATSLGKESAITIGTILYQNK